MIGVRMTRCPSRILVRPKALLAHSSSIHSLATLKNQHVCSLHTQENCGGPDADNNYERVFKQALEKPREFWQEKAANIDWFKGWETALDNTNPGFPKWFVGGELNVSYNAVDRHVERGYGHQVAVIHDSPVTQSQQRITFSQLLHQVSRFAAVLVKHGVKMGDRVIISMPNIPQAMVAMLATTRIGAIHSVVWGGFASKQLASRINHAQARVVVSANCGMDGSKVINYKQLLDSAITMSDHKPETCIIVNRKHDAFSPATMVKERDVCYDEEMERTTGHDCVPVDASHPMYILYTSGTTGNPKGVVRPTGGHLVNLFWTMYNVYGVRPNEVWFAASDLGWVVGHSYTCYGPLIHRNTTVLLEGKPVGTPDAGTHFRILQEHNVAAMFVAPSAIRAIRKEDPGGSFAKRHSFPGFRSLFVGGERCDLETVNWARQNYGVPVLDNWWQTETGSPVASGCAGLENDHDLKQPRGMSGKPVPGWNVKVLRADGSETVDDELGSIVIREPLAPGAFSGLWKDESRSANYFSEGYYKTMDVGIRDKEGRISVMARLDDVINVAGHRLSTSQMEEAILEHPMVIDCAVVAKPDKIKGEMPFGFVVVRDENDKPAGKISQEVVDLVRSSVGPVASLREVVVVGKLPKTNSGKIARNTLSAMINQKPYKIPVTIEDANVYVHLMEVLKKEGYTPSQPTE